MTDVSRPPPHPRAPAHPHLHPHPQQRTHQISGRAVARSQHRKLEWQRAKQTQTQETRGGDHPAPHTTVHAKPPPAPPLHRSHLAHVPWDLFLLTFFAMNGPPSLPLRLLHPTTEDRCWRPGHPAKMSAAARQRSIVDLLNVKPFERGLTLIGYGAQSFVAVRQTIVPCGFAGRRRLTLRGAQR